MFSQGIRFCPHSKLCVPSGYTISRFLIVFYVLSGSGSGSPGGTTPSIVVPSTPPPPPPRGRNAMLITDRTKRIARILLEQLRTKVEKYSHFEIKLCSIYRKGIFFVMSE